jgi:hypothetical protein
MILGMDAVLADFGDAERDTITAYLRGVADVYRARLSAAADAASVTGSGAAEH